MTLRILHTSDWHLGRKLHGESLSEAHEKFLDWFIDDLIPAEKPHLIVVSGDIYDRGIPPTEVIELFEDSIARIQALGTPILITSGNHDSSVRLGSNTRWLDRFGLHFRTRISEISKPVVIEGDDFNLLAYGIPYIEPDADTGKGENQLDVRAEHTDVLNEAIKRIKDNVKSNRGSKPIRTLVASHAFVTGGIAVDSERPLKIGGADNADAAVFAGIDYVAMGHLHGAQYLSEMKQSTIRYSGSPIPFSFSEREHEKQVLLVTIDRDGVNHKSVKSREIPQIRKMRYLEDTLENVLRYAESDSNRDDWMHINLKDQTVAPGVYDALKARYPHLLKWEYNRDGRNSIYVPNQDGMKLNSPLEITKRFYERVTEEKPSEQINDLIEDCCESVNSALSQVKK
jgi:exonuclease SbcD